MSETIRSFVAFDLESESVLEKLTQVQAQLLATEADLKLVEAKNIHLTVRFLGNITANSIEKIFECMRKVRFSPFEVKVFGVGAFPDVRYPRVVWAGITEGADKMRDIFSQLEPCFQGLGFAADPKGFSPHLTIARVRSGRNKAELAKLINDITSYEFGIVRAACLRLKRSELTSKGPIYSTLKEVCP